MPAELSILGLYQIEPNLFYYFEVPDGLNKQLAVEKILMDCGAFEVLYPDPEFMQQMIRIWSAGCQEVWNHLNETLHYDYNPIWNKDGLYKEERILNTNTKAENTGQVVGFNSADFTNATHGSGSGEGHEGEKIERREQGNIGVTTTQQMIKEEREIAEFNMYDYIAADFKNRFCLLVY